MDRAPRALPAATLVHAAIFVAQAGSGAGAIVGKFGVHGTNPVLFVLLREAAAGCILFGASLAGGRGLRASLPPCHSLRLVLAAGFCIFGNQLCFIIGLKLADPVSGSCWQLSQPIFTALLGTLAGTESPSSRKSFGILMSVAGGSFMVLYDPVGTTSTPNSELGHVLFFCNCFLNACYLVVSKQLVRTCRPLCVVGWGYIVAATCMAHAALLVSWSPTLLSIICTDASEEVRHACMREAWTVPSSMIAPLAYWIAVSGVMTFWLLTWANQFAQTSVVAAYTVVQPVTSGLISAILILAFGFPWAQQYGLRPPGLKDIGIFGVIAGLRVLSREPLATKECDGTKAEDNVVSRGSSTSKYVELGKPASRAIGHALESDDGEPGLE